MTKKEPQNSNHDVPAIAKGAQPDFFNDPATEALHGMLIILLEQICVLNDRLDTYERLGAEGVAVTKEAVDAYEPTESVEAFREQRRQQTIGRVMRPVKALQVASVNRAQHQYKVAASEIAGFEIQQTSREK